jgi:hypothetical protein
MTEDTCTEDTTCGLAKKEFRVIRDLLLVPLKQDEPDEELPERRKWKGGCIPVGLPDLVPINIGEPVKGFCKRNDENKLVITVKNQGNATASQSITRVIFFPQEANPIVIANIPTKEIPAGKCIDLVVNETPVRCSLPSGCQFVIIVNADFRVIESDFTNNVAIGLCAGIL